MSVKRNPDFDSKAKQFQGSMDDLLTSLHWLQNFSSFRSDPEPPTGTPLYLGSPVTSGKDFTKDPNLGEGDPPTPVQTGPQVELDYKANREVKPPYSHTSLICMAMEDSKQPKVTLGTIYKWITENFAYYRHTESNWQNSIRHNLCINKCFKRVARQKDEPGKGGFWQIDPMYADKFVNGIFTRRRMSANNNNNNNNNNSGAHGEVDTLVQRGALKRKKHIPKKNNKRAKRSTDSPLLETEAHKAHFVRGDFDLPSVIHDVLVLECDVEVSIQGRQHSPGLGSRDLLSPDHRSDGSVEVSGASMECSVNMGEFHGPHQDQDLLLQGHQHVQQTSTLQDEEVLQDWKEIIEEAQLTPESLDQDFSLCEDLFTEEPWEWMESYL